MGLFDIDPETTKDKTTAPAETPATLYWPVTDELAALWQPGTRKHIEANLPELAQEIDQAEAEVYRCWLAVDDGTGTLGDFRAALHGWRQANRQAIQAYRDSLRQPRGEVTSNYLHKLETEALGRE